MISYRFIIKGEDNWMKLKEILATVEHECLGKARFRCGTCVYHAEIDKTNLEAISDKLNEIGAKYYENTQNGCLIQAKDEGGDLMRQFYRTNQLMDLFREYGTDPLYMGPRKGGMGV